MVQNIQNQNNTNNYNLSAYIKSSIKSDIGGKNSSNIYAKKGEPAYLKQMDTDNDGSITMDEFKQYCKENDVSTNEMAKMLELRMAYGMSKDVSRQLRKSEKDENSESFSGELELIYAEENDSKYDENMDSDADSRVSYKEYLRYCEQNAKTKTKTKKSDTKIRENDKSKFMTISYGKIASAYNKLDAEIPEGKVESIA